jgi:hypothetical protein
MVKRYVLDYTVRPPVCLPAELDRSKLIDVTSVECEFRVFVDRDTGKVHDGNVHFWHFKCGRLCELMGWHDAPRERVEAERVGGRSA